MGEERRERPARRVADAQEADRPAGGRDRTDPIDDVENENDLPVDVAELIGDTAPDVVLEEDNRLRHTPFSEEIVGEEVGESLLAIDADTNAEEVIEEIEHYTLDDEIIDEFADRQRLAYGSNELALKARQNPLESPDLAAGDIDAGWEWSAVGEELPGGSVATPDQDVVDEIGAAVGLTYEDNEPLRGADKVGERDRDRWELDPASNGDGYLLDVGDDDLSDGWPDEDLNDDWLDEDLEPYAEELDEIDAELEMKDEED